MTFWLDAHFDSELAAWLGSRYGVTVKTLAECGLRDAKDIDIFRAGGRFNEIVIISKDADFADLSNDFGAPPQIIWVRFGNRSTVRIQNLLSQSMPEAITLLKAGQPLVELTE